MHWGLRLSLPVVLIAAVGCSPSAPTPSTPSSTTAASSRVNWLSAALTSTGAPAAATAAVKTSAVIDGFRVHPDPGDDGVIHISADQSVAVNATDIASRPPAPQSYLVVNWGDGPNQRVGCGPCRADHSYGVGRYTLVASADNLPAGTDRSITVVVQVSPTREHGRPISADGPVQPFSLSSDDIAVGETTFFLIPATQPQGVTFPSGGLFCTPPDAAFFDDANAVLVAPDVAQIPIVGVAPGTCTFILSGLFNGDPFTQSLTFTVH